MKIINLIFSLTLMIGFISCTSDPKASEPEKTSLYGKWELTEARNEKNKPTPQLDGAFLQFKEDGTMTTNILGGDPQNCSFELNNKTLVQKTNQSVKYNIEKLEGDEMIAVMNIASKKFKIKLTKVE